MRAEFGDFLCEGFRYIKLRVIGAGVLGCSFTEPGYFKPTGALYGGELDGFIGGSGATIHIVAEIAEVTVSLGGDDGGHHIWGEVVGRGGVTGAYFIRGEGHISGAYSEGHRVFYAV